MNTEIAPPSVVHQNENDVRLLTGYRRYWLLRLRRCRETCAQQGRCCHQDSFGCGSWTAFGFWALGFGLGFGVATEGVSGETGAAAATAVGAQEKLVISILLETVSPENISRPVSISYNTTPYDQMYARLSTGMPRACSGLM